MSPDEPQTKIVSGFALTVATAAHMSPEAETRWAQRAEILANWLLGEWQRALGQSSSAATTMAVVVGRDFTTHPT